MKATVQKHRKLKLNLLRNPQPVKIAQQRKDVIELYKSYMGLEAKSLSTNQKPQNGCGKNPCCSTDT